MWTSTSRKLAGAVRARGERTAFYGRALLSIGEAVRRYPSEVLRVISQMGLGVGALAIIGGTVVVMGFLTISTGSLVAIQGYATLSDVGVEAMTGFLSAFFNVRMIAPSTAGVAMSATIGAGATAQLGAMRINEEIDALDVLGIRTVAFLMSTRIVAGVAVVIPLYCIAVVMTFFAARFLTVSLYGQSSGVYEHYFTSFLQPFDLFWSFIATALMATTVMVIHTFYGFTATGGPAGVGEAVGRSVRASMIATAFIICTFMLAVYGQSGHFHLSG
ncbi:ABC transporter permease [Mycolicibacterium moriokaense]|nr:ABC transporter permease [Mycolicibacterium moriokaense]